MVWISNALSLFTRRARLVPLAIIEEQAVQADRPSLPMAQVTLLPSLADFAPIWPRMHEVDVKPLAQAAKTPLKTLAQMQADALDDVWPALETHLNDDRAVFHPRFKADDLKSVFIGAARHLRVMQFQMPAILSLDDEPNLSSELRNLPDIQHSETNGVYGDDTIATHAIRHEFGLVNLKRMYGTMPGLISIPLTMIEPAVLDAFLESGQRAALESLQRVVARVSHDYYHQMQPIHDTTFFSAENLREADLPLELKSRFHMATGARYDWEEAVVPHLKKRQLEDLDADLFEPHALTLHKNVFAHMWKRAHFREAMMQDVAWFIEGVKRAKPYFEGQEIQSLYNQPIDYKNFAAGAVVILAHYLYRVAPPGHEIFNHLSQCAIGLNLRRKDMRDILPILAKDLPAGMSGRELAIWHAGNISRRSFGIIHDEDFIPMNHLSRNRARREMVHALKGLESMRPGGAI